MPLRNSRLLHPRFHQEIRRSAVGDRGYPDECTITRPGTGEGTTDPATGIWTPPAATVVYTGCCRVQGDTRTQGKIQEKGDEIVALHRYRAGVPWDVDQVLVDDVLTVTCSEDPVIVGRPLMVRDFVLDTFLVRRTLLLEDHPHRT